ncbi:hypothetical protein H5970_24335 [Amycolatopsis sp. CM201R]|nr:hypothetical protein [Amycolatopsis sp. 505]MDS0145498.1 hypothetical protein [Amycolatopsis sp. CM201R]
MTPSRIATVAAHFGRDVAFGTALAAEMVMCFGYTEADPRGERYSAAACVSGNGVRGRVGMLLDYERAFPEPSLGLAVDGPKSSPACVRAVENQVVFVCANQAGVPNGTRFPGSAEIDVAAEIAAARDVRDHLGERKATTPSVA